MTLEQLVYRKFNERLAIYKDQLFNAPNWEEYQRLRGYIQGMQELLRELDPIIKDPVDAGDEDE